MINDTFTNTNDDNINNNLSNFNINYINKLNINGSAFWNTPRGKTVFLKNIKSLLNLSSPLNKINNNKNNFLKTSLSDAKELVQNLYKKCHEYNKETLTKLNLIVDKNLDNTENNKIDNTEKCKMYINHNPLYQKNNKSLTIRNKFIDYNQAIDNINSHKNEQKEKIFSFSKKFVNNTNNTSLNSNTEEELNNNYQKQRICCICNNGDSEENQFILTCVQCNVNVHQNCYGAQIKDLNNWKCDACHEMSKNEVDNLECVLCPVKGGAFKKVELPQNSNFYKTIFDYKHQKCDLPKANYSIIIPENTYKNIKCAWAHMSCVLWNPNINFGNFEKKTQIHMERISFSNFNNYCDLCKTDNSGPTIKCNNDNCSYYFHPECARINNCCLEVEIIGKELQYNIYCYKHKPNLMAKKINRSVNNDIKQVTNFNNELNNLYELYKKLNKVDFYQKQKVMNRIEIVKNNSIFNKHAKKLRKSYHKKIISNDNNSINLSHISHSHKKLLKKEIKTQKLKKYSKNIKDKFIAKNITITVNNNINNNFIFQPGSTLSVVCPQISHPSIEIQNTKNNLNNIFNGSPINLQVSISDYKKYNFEEDFKENKDNFIVYLIGFLNDYTLNNRIIVDKNYTNFITLNDDKAPIFYLKYKDFDEGNIPWDIGFNNYSPTLIKKFFFKAFPNEAAYKKYFVNKIENVLMKLEKNNEFKELTIQCDNKEQCIGAKNGNYKLLSLNKFKYQFLSENVKVFDRFICSNCLNNIPNKAALHEKKSKKNETPNINININIKNTNK